MKLKKQFKDFYDEICIHGESEDLKEKRDILQSDIEDYFPSEMEKHDIELKKSDIEIFDQGSYKYSTTIRASVIDRDVAVMIPLDKEEYSDPRKIKGYLRDAINHVAARKTKIKEPCIIIFHFTYSTEHILKISYSYMFHHFFSLVFLTFVILYTCKFLNYWCINFFSWSS